MNASNKSICCHTLIDRLEISLEVSNKGFFLARALAQESAVYLMDEPFAGVDAVTEKTIISILQEMKKKEKL